MCDRLQTPNNPAHMPGGIREAKDFGDTVAIDLFSLADCFGQTQQFLNSVDLASAFQIVVPVDSKHPSHVYEKLFDYWIVWAGPPDRLVCDNGGEFKRELSEEL